MHDPSTSLDRRVVVTVLVAYGRAVLPLSSSEPRQVTFPSNFLTVDFKERRSYTVMLLGFQANVGKSDIMAVEVTYPNLRRLIPGADILFPPCDEPSLYGQDEPGD
jgi:hypothetical protein